MEKITLEIQDGKLDYYSNVFENIEADRLFLKLKENLDWKQEEIKIFGKTHDIPRLQAWYADEGIQYSYSGIDLLPAKWTDELLQIKALIQTIIPYEFNSVLANLYRTGQDSNGWHADNEKELGKNPVIASITLGQERYFKIKHIRDNSLKKDLLLEHGSLLVMSGAMQNNWKHTIAKTKKPIGERLNLTFRRIIK